MWHTSVVLGFKISLRCSVYNVRTKLFLSGAAYDRCTLYVYKKKNTEDQAIIEKESMMERAAKMTF